MAPDRGGHRAWSMLGLFTYVPRLFGVIRYILTRTLFIVTFPTVLS